MKQCYRLIKSENWIVNTPLAWIIAAKTIETQKKWHNITINNISEPLCTPPKQVLEKLKQKHTATTILDTPLP